MKRWPLRRCAHC